MTRDEAAQLLADALERVRLAEDRCREACRVLDQAKVQLESATRRFRAAFAATSGAAQ